LYIEQCPTEGTVVRILEEDDGSGWIKVDDGAGGKGLVPATYVELASAGGPPMPTPVVSSPALASQGSGKYGMF
jgi:formin-binding protein 1